MAIKPLGQKQYLLGKYKNPKGKYTVSLQIYSSRHRTYNEARLRIGAFPSGVFPEELAKLSEMFAGTCYGTLSRAHSEEGPHFSISLSGPFDKVFHLIQVFIEGKLLIPEGFSTADELKNTLMLKAIMDKDGQ